MYFTTTTKSQQQNPSLLPAPPHTHTTSRACARIPSFPAPTQIMTPLMASRIAVCFNHALKFFLLWSTLCADPRSMPAVFTTLTAPHSPPACGLHSQLHISAHVRKTASDETRHAQTSFSLPLLPHIKGPAPATRAGALDVRLHGSLADAAVDHGGVVDRREAAQGLGFS